MALTVFTFHRIFPHEAPDAISCDMFRKQIDYLSDHFRILNPTDMAAYIAGNLQESRPCAALTFDDGWLDNLIYATPILKERNVQATIAFSAGFLHDARRRCQVPHDLLKLDMNACHQRAASGDLTSFLSRDEWKAMLDSSCWKLEPHGTRHTLGPAGISLLAAVQNGESNEQFQDFLRDDLEYCLEQRAQLTSEPARFFFWPWGHYSDLSVTCLTELGFKRQFTVSKGCICGGDQRSVLPRVGVSPRKRKFLRNCLVFRSPLLSRLHHLISHTQQVKFADRVSVQNNASPS